MAAPADGRRVTDVQYFAACVAIWSTTWIAITFQLGTVPPEMSVAYRFLLASLLLFAWCVIRGLPLRFSAREHGWLALFGLGSFGVGYVFVYYAEQHVVSGLVAVGYSASPLLGMLGMRFFFGTPMTRRVAVASVLGIAGIIIVFYPELARLQGSRETAKGALFTTISVLIATGGSMVAYRNQRAGVPLWQGMAWGMFYGAMSALAIGLASGKPPSFLATSAYVLSLAYLAILGSIIAFASYLTLLKRLGAARAGYIGVMVPILALLLSAAFEGFRFHALTWVGIGVSVAGNVLILRIDRA
ncbi:MAG TPA: EamA family transporter [Burkholderiales bacterium]|nr:EamA family transporter [Burkholderiales bacterium]